MRDEGRENVVIRMKKKTNQTQQTTGESDGKSRFHSDRVSSYFRAEWRVLLAVTLSGLLYNFGLLAGPWFEGRLAGCLVDILSGNASFSEMLHLVVWYVAIIGTVQGMRYIKRFYVRRFANNVNRSMKKVLYHNLLGKSKAELEQEGIGNVMTKAISDVDDCAEGMRKFTTEIFDTGVALVCYCGMLLYYDWRLTLLGLVFPPISYFIAEKMKKPVHRTGAEYKNQAGKLSADTMDRVSNALLYRIFGCEAQRREAYERRLSDYETAAVKANIWVAALPPLYHVICMVSVLFLLYFGARNVLGQGWSSWDIAAFTTFLSCYTKLSVKSSKAAKLFNSVQKAQVSWKRIKPFMAASKPSEATTAAAVASMLTVRDLSVSYTKETPVFAPVSFDALPGQIIGITGPVACGKSTLGKAFLHEYPYSGSIQFDGRELSDLPDALCQSIVGYLGHDPELLNESIRENILMGDREDAEIYLRAVCLDQEVRQMKNGMETVVGNGGVKLSGGQAQRLALARTLCHKKPILILDDPFSALDRDTEQQVFFNLKKLAKDSVILLISHRLYLFPQCQQIIWMEQGKIVTGTHDELMSQVPQYAELYCAQEGGSAK